MKRACLFLLVVSMVLMVDCSKEREIYDVDEQAGNIKVFKIKDKPSVTEFSPNIEKLFEISSEDPGIKDPGRKLIWPRYLDIDSNGNIYIVDSPSSSVKKFDHSGKFIKSFGREGSGPGEMNRPFLINILNDIMYVTDPYNSRLVKFDTEGEYRGEIKLKRGIPNFMQSVGRDKLIAFMSRAEQIKKGVIRLFNLVLLDLQFEELAVLNRYSIPFTPQFNDFHDRYTAYAVGKDKIFVAQNSEDQYKINVFDFNGKLLYSIEKEYKKILFNKEERHQLNESVRSLFKKSGIDNVPPIDNRYKKAINKMFCDEEGRLLVAFSMKRDESNQYDFWVDVFKEQQYLNRMKLDIFKACDYVTLQNEKILFKGGRIYHIDELNAVIKVYKY